MDETPPALTVYYIKGSPGTLALSQSLDVPGTPCSLAYLNEGGANFVFQFVSSQYRLLPDQVKGRLLRMRKDISHVQPTTDLSDSFNRDFRGLFPPDNLIAHDLVKLDHRLPVLLNSLMGDLIRPSHRLQDYLPTDEQYGLLITDMTAGPGDVLLQVKPKWLLQSPNAPPEAKRCRTCALRAQRASQKIRTATDAQESCPLDLVSADIRDRIRFAQSITKDDELGYYLVHDAQPLLQTLRRLQLSFDPNGALKVSSTDQMYDLCKAMTLRDCTLFVRRTPDGIEARLGDLDLKQPERFSRWKQMEQNLIKDGWYTNTEAGAVRTIENRCYLSRY